MINAMQHVPAMVKQTNVEFDLTKNERLPPIMTTKNYALVCRDYELWSKPFINDNGDDDDDNCTFYDPLLTEPLIDEPMPYAFEGTDEGSLVVDHSSEASDVCSKESIDSDSDSTHPALIRRRRRAQHGDDRMKRAILARLYNPKLTLHEAILIGGFTYSQNQYEQRKAKALDVSHVTLAPRKNQLSRRLRLFHVDYSSEASDVSSNESNDRDSDSQCHRETDGTRCAKNHRTRRKAPHGDDRMKRAILARLYNPKLTLHEAILIGGFTYPQNQYEQRKAKALDVAHVTLAQRKNQLSRRLRLLREEKRRRQHQQTTTER